MTKYSMSQSEEKRLSSHNENLERLERLNNVACADEAAVMQEAQKVVIEEAGKTVMEGEQPAVIEDAGQPVMQKSGRAAMEQEGAAMTEGTRAEQEIIDQDC